MTKGVIKDGQGLSVSKSVTTEPMDMTVSTIVVDTALTTLHVTNKLVTVTGDVNRDLQTRTAARNVPPVTLEWLAVSVAVTIV